MLIQVRRYGRHHYVSVVGAVYRRGRRRASRRLWRTCLGRCDDEGKRRAMREVVKDYRPLERAGIVIGEVEEASVALTDRQRAVLRALGAPEPPALQSLTDIVTN